MDCLGFYCCLFLDTLLKARGKKARKVSLLGTAAETVEGRAVLMQDVLGVDFSQQCSYPVLPDEGSLE